MNIINATKRLFLRVRLWWLMRQMERAQLRLKKKIGAAVMPSAKAWIDAINQMMERHYLEQTKFVLNMSRKHKRASK